MSATVRTIGVLGRSYCGSTLLNYLLGSHPLVYGGSELKRLLEQDPHRRCAVCGDACVVWTAENLAAAYRVGPQGLHEFLRELMDRPVVCDASKSIGHFRRVARVVPDGVAWVVMTKHPLRHLSSFVVHGLYRDTGAPDLEQARASVTTKAFKRFVRGQIAELHRFYARVERRRAWFERRGTLRYARYERLVADPEEVLTGVLAGTGVAFDPGMLDYASREHHPIGGNSGPHWQARRKAGHRGTWPGKDPYTRAFYESTDGLRMDDKWRTALTGDQVRLMTGAPGYDELCARLGYEASADPRDGRSVPATR